MNIDCTELSSQGGRILGLESKKNGEEAMWGGHGRRENEKGDVLELSILLMLHRAPNAMND